MMVIKNSLRRTALISCSAFLASCVGPDFVRPIPPNAEGYTATPLPATTASAATTGGEAQHFQPGKDIPAQWWTLFHSDPLNALIDEAIKANPNVQAAQAALRGARETVLAQQGGFWPSLLGGANASRSKNANGSVSSSSTSSSDVYNLYTAQLTVSYTPDVWGENWREVESLEAQAEAQRFQLEATTLTLTANVVSTAVAEAGLRAQITATREIMAIESELLEVLKKQFALGQIAEADVVAQQAVLAQAEQTLPPLERQLAQQRNALSALLGRMPTQQPEATFQLTSLQLPEDLPVSLPSRLVEQRPDVRQAEANFHAASAQVGVAIANRLPVINITANMGSTAPFVGGKQGLFTPGMGFWNLAGGLTEPLFDGFTLLHKERAARAAYEQAGAQYRSTVISAFQNVADALTALVMDAESLKAAVKAEKAASDSLIITRRQLELGSVSYLALLNAQQADLQARIILTQAQANRFADTAGLFQALGGGWWNRPEASAE